jgi:hypothetical protein
LLDDLNAWCGSVSTPEATNTQNVLHFPPKFEAFLAKIYQIIDEVVLGLTRGQRGGPTAAGAINYVTADAAEQFELK